MTTRQSHKRRGAKFEIELEEWLRLQGKESERLVRTGKDDQGDVYFSGANGKYVIEAKAPGESGRIKLSEWIKEAVVEAANYAFKRKHKAAPTPLVIIKARGKSISESYVVLRLEDAIKFF